MESPTTPKKPRILCLHGGGSNASELKEALKVWPDYVVEKMDLVFINAPFPTNDDDEHFEWYARDEVVVFNKIPGNYRKPYVETYENFNEGIAYIEERMVELGPFDGVLGKSQGGIVTGVLPGLQKQGLCLTKVQKIEHVIVISGAKLGGITFPGPKLAEAAFSSPINIPSLHIFGEHDFAKETAPELVEAYVDPLVIYHHGGHEVPILDEEGLKIMFEFLKKINAIV